MEQLGMPKDVSANAASRSRSLSGCSAMVHLDMTIMVVCCFISIRNPGRVYDGQSTGKCWRGMRESSIVMP